MPCRFLNARNIGIVSPERFWQLLQSTAHTSIVDIFGPAIHPFRNGCIVDVGTGKASLGCLIPANPPKLSVTRDARIRVDITDGTPISYRSAPVRGRPQNPQREPYQRDQCTNPKWNSSYSERWTDTTMETS